jgi:hypothetical protein
MNYSKSIILFSCLALASVVACKTKKAVATNVESAETKACSEKLPLKHYNHCWLKVAQPVDVMMRGKNA